MTLARGLALGGAILLLLLTSSVARADTYCVVPAGGCDAPHTFATVQAALTGVAGNGVADTIQLGAATYSQDNMTYAGSDPVSLVGAGTASTTLQRATAGANTKVLWGSGTGKVSLSQLHVHLSFVSTSSVEGVRLQSGGSIDDVLIDADAGTYNPTGVTLAGVSSLTHSTIDVPSGGACMQIGSATTTITDDLLTHCSAAVNAQSQSTTAVQRLRVVDAGIGVDVGGSSTLTIEDSLMTFSGGGGTGMELAASGVGTTVLNANHLTLIGSPSGGIGVEAFNHVSPNATLNLSHTIIRGFTNSLKRDTTATHPASIVADYNDYNVATVSDLGGPGSLTSNHVYDNVDPQFVNAGAGDYHLAAASPLVDQDPAPLGALETPVDFDGHPRIINGARDLGAFERLVAPTATTGGASAITGTRGTVAGVVNPGGAQAMWHVVFGPTSAYGSSTTDSPLNASGADQPVSTVLTGLSPGTTYHYSFRATNSIGLGLGADRTFTTTGRAGPKLSALKLSPSSFAAARSGASLSAATGSRVRYKLSSAATVSFRVRRLLPGVRAGRRCVARGRKHKSGRPCTRAVLVKGSFKRVSTAGANSAHFSGRVGRRALRPGRYRLTGTPAGGKAASVKFKIVPRAKRLVSGASERPS